MKRITMLSLVLLAACGGEKLTAREVCQDIAFTVCQIAVSCGQIPESGEGNCAIDFEEKCCPDWGCDWESEQTPDGSAACAEALQADSCDIFGSSLPPECPAPRGGLRDV